MNKRRISVMLISALLILAAMACENTTPLEAAQPFGTPSPYNQEALQAAYAAAQATLVSGQSEIMELSHQATLVSLNMDQAANAAEQATLDYNQRQLMELSIRATEISQNMARAAATQQLKIEQTRIARNATDSAQSQAATATYSAYILNVTETAQAKAMLDVQATQNAYSLTATPWAITQADITRTRNETERRAWWEEFVVTPLIVILLTLVVLLLIVGGVLVYQRLKPAPDTTEREDESPLRLVDGMIVDSDPRPREMTGGVLRQHNLTQHPSDETPQVEIIGPSEPSITNWITEAERKLRSDERMRS